MIQQLYDDYIFIYGMAGLCVLGTILKIMVSRTYKRLIKASDNMGSTKHKLMKLMKMKFEACYKLKIGVNNVDIFVDKYVYKHKICGIHLYTWENIGGQLLILCLLGGTVGSVLGLVYNCGKNDILITFFSGVFTSSLLIVVESFINLGAKKSILKANITDYLENFLKVRLEQENFTPEVLEEYRREYFNNKVKDNDKKDKKKDISDVEVSPVVENKIIRKHRVIEELSAEEKPYVQGERTKRERNKEMLLREKELNAKQVKIQHESEEKVDKGINKSVNEVQRSQPSVYSVKENKGENMRFLIKSLEDTAASQEEISKEQEQIFVKEEVKHEKDNQRMNRTEKEEKIIEDILKEFLA